MKDKEYFAEENVKLRQKRDCGVTPLPSDSYGFVVRHQSITPHTDPP